MIDQCNEDARSVFELASKIGRNFQHDSLRSEHLLIALANFANRNKGSGLARLFKASNLCPRVVRSEVEKLIVSGVGIVSGDGELPTTPDIKIVFELARENSRELGSELVGCEDLLIAISKRKDLIGGMILWNLGCSL